MIGAKTANSRSVLLRALRDHPLLANADAVRLSADRLSDSAAAVRDANSLDTLRGVEGEAAQLYFGALDNLILQNKAEFNFASRSRRPADRQGQRAAVILLCDHGKRMRVGA